MGDVNSSRITITEMVKGLEYILALLVRTVGVIPRATQSFALLDALIQDINSKLLIPKEMVDILVRLFLFHSSEFVLSPLEKYYWW